MNFYQQGKKLGIWSCLLAEFNNLKTTDFMCQIIFNIVRPTKNILTKIEK